MDKIDTLVWLQPLKNGLFEVHVKYLDQEFVTPPLNESDALAKKKQSEDYLRSIKFSK